MGKVGAVVELKGSVDVEKLEEVGKKLAMHVVAASPKYLSIDDIPEEVMEEEKSILAKQLEVRLNCYKFSLPPLLTHNPNKPLLLTGRQETRRHKRENDEGETQQVGF